MTRLCDPMTRPQPQPTCDPRADTIVMGKRLRHLDNCNRPHRRHQPSGSQLSSKQSCHGQASSSRSSQITTTAAAAGNNLPCPRWSLSSASLATTCRRRQHRTWPSSSSSGSSSMCPTTIPLVGPLICILLLSVLVQAHWQENLIPRRRISHISKCTHTHTHINIIHMFEVAGEQAGGITPRKTRLAAAVVPLELLCLDYSSSPFFAFLPFG